MMRAFLNNICDYWFAARGNTRFKYCAVALLVLGVQTWGCVRAHEHNYEIAEPIVVPGKREVDPTRMPLVDIAISEAMEELELSTPYNIEYYYGYYGLEDERRATVAFHPIDLLNTEVIEVVFAISVVRKSREQSNLSRRDGDYAEREAEDGTKK